jgi:hypothetical protein
MFNGSHRKDRQTLDTLKVSAVIGEQGEVVAQGGGAYQEIEVADKRPHGPEPAAFLRKYPANRGV